MEGGLLYLILAVLGVVILVYAIYRLVTDRDAGENRHALYPFTSFPTDSMFPGKRSYLGWAGYLVALVGMMAFLAGLFLDIAGRSIPEYLFDLLRVCIALGVLIVAVSAFRGKRKDNRGQGKD